MADVIVQVTFPENVFRGCSCLLAGFAFALIVLYELSRVKAVGSSDASANDALQKSVHFWVIAISELELIVVVEFALSGCASKVS